MHHNSSCGAASVTISDTGTAFNPLTMVPAERPRAPAEAQPGGQGLALLRCFADALDYRHGEGHNHLTIKVRWEGAR